MHENHQPSERAAVRHLLRAPAVWQRADAYVGTDDVDWAGLLTEADTMSGGESLLVRIAHDLWHATQEVAVWEIPRRLDSRYFERVIEAMRMCHGWSALTPLRADLDTGRPLQEPSRLRALGRPASAS
jgi:hypothetical protein